MFSYPLKASHGTAAKQHMVGFCIRSSPQNAQSRNEGSSIHADNKKRAYKKNNILSFHTVSLVT